MSDNQVKRTALDSLKSQYMGEGDQPSLPLPEQPDQQLIEREEIEGTPFALISTEEKAFITFGKYRVSEYEKTKEEALGALTNKFWDIMLNVITLVITLEKDQEKEG